MSDSSKYPSFTAADIERYHKGQMSAEERHTLEKAALEDPFLSDALEGYLYTSTPAADLSQIRARLVEKTRRRKTVPLISRHSGWLRIAALVAVVAGSGWFLLRTFQPAGNTIALERKAEDAETPKPQKQTLAADSLSSQGTVSNNWKNETGSYPLDTTNGKAMGRSGSSYNFTTTQNSPQQTLQADEAAKPENKDAADSKIANGNTINATNSRPATLSNNAIVSNQQTSPSPDAGNLNNYRKNQAKEINNNADVVINTSKAPVRQEELKLTDSTTNLNIVLTPLPMDTVSEVLVSTRTDRLKKFKANKEPIVIIDSLEPTGGRASFDEYVLAHLQPPEEVQKKERSGVVELGFDLDDKGQPVNITVLKSLCEKCDEEAIRLLKEGPKWKKKKNRKGKIRIRF